MGKLGGNAQLKVVDYYFLVFFTLFTLNIILVFYKTPISADQKRQNCTVIKLADKYNLSPLGYSKCLEQYNTGPDKNGRKDR